eukprot:6203308-Pleurochrysis_carterae.AAC.1
MPSPSRQMLTRAFAHASPMPASGRWGARRHRQQQRSSPCQTPRCSARCASSWARGVTYMQMALAGSTCCWRRWTTIPGNREAPSRSNKEGMEVNKELLDDVLKAPEYRGRRFATRAMRSYGTPAYMLSMAHVMKEVCATINDNHVKVNERTKPHVYYQSNCKITTINLAVAKKLLEKLKRRDKPFVVNWNGNSASAKGV